MSAQFGLINRRGFYLAVGEWMLSCHVNGYGHGSQFALNRTQRTGSYWYGWWSDSGWAIKRQKPIRFFVDGKEVPVVEVTE